MNRRFLVFILIILGALSLDAQNIIRPKVECPNGIYVNSYNGVLFYQRPDVSLNNRSLRLEAVFYYNSSSNRTNYGYGNGWSLGHELRFVNDSLGVIIEQGDGRRDLYTRYGSGFEAPAGVFSTLSVEGDGYLLTYKDGTKYYFTDTVHKQLTQLKDRYDNTLDFGYEDGRLTSITDISGRSLYFTWTDSLMTGLHTSFDDRTWSYRYDDRGNLTCVTDPMGYSVYYGYTDDNRIKTFTDAEGYSTHISYNVDGMAHRIKTDLTDKSIRYELAKGQTIFIDYLKDAHNQYTKYIWDDKGRLVEIENVNMHTSTKFAYDDDNNMVRREDANGNAYTFTYDQNGNRLSTTDPLDYTDYCTYESTFNKVTSYTDKMGNLYTYQYDSHGDLLQMNGPLNFNIICTYNEFGRMTSTTDANGNVTTYDYDNYGNLASITDALGNVMSMTYNMAGMPLTQTQPNGAVSSFVFDSNERMLSLIDPLNFVMQMTYDKKGNMTSLQDGRSNTMNFAYDAVGNMIQQTNALGAHHSLLYNAKGYVTEMVDALGAKNRMKYNDMNLVFLSIGPKNDTIQCYHDNVGNVIGLKMPNGRVITSEFDALNRLVSQSDQIGTMYSCTYDPNGRVLSYTNAEGHTSTFEYDALGRIMTNTDALGNSIYYSYDANGNMLTRLDRNGHATIYTYDAMNRRISATDALGNVTNYIYDAMGKVVQITNALGNATNFERDLKGKLVKLTYANGSTNKYWYDEVGNMIRREDEKGTLTQYVYNQANQLIRTDHPDQSSDYYTYDLNGRLLTAVNQNAEVEYSYDVLGRLLSESINGSVTSYQYDDDYSHFAMVYPSGESIIQELDLRNRVRTVTKQSERSVIASFEYDGLNRVIQKTLGNGISTSFTYDAVGNVTQMYDNSNILSYEFSYDSEGNLITKKDLLNESCSKRYFYNENNQLVDYLEGEMDSNYQIVSPVNTIQYVYYPTGMMASETINGVSHQYNYNALNAITAVVGGSEVTYQYDENGNLINDGNHTYQYNALNQLESVDNGNTTSYLYDALGRKIQRTYSDDLGLHSESYQYSGTSIIESYDGSGDQLSSNFYTMSGVPLQRQFGADSYFYHFDQSQSTTAMTNYEGNIVESYNYSPHGHVSFYDGDGQEQQSSIMNNTIYSNGTTYEAETGLYSCTYDFGAQFVMNSDNGMGVQKDNALVGAGSVNNLYAPSSNGEWEWTDDIMDFLGTAGDEMINYFLGDQSFLEAYLRNVAYTESDQVIDLKFMRGLEKLDQLRELVGKCTTLMELGKAVLGLPGLVQKVTETDSFADELALYGDYASGMIGIVCPMLGLIDSAVRIASGGEYGLISGMAWVVGKMIDYGMDRLEEGCERFKESGYENASWLQKRFADFAQLLPTNEYFYATGLPITDLQAQIIYHTWNFVENAWDSFMIWLTGDHGETSAYTGTLVGPGSVAPMNW